MGTTQQHLLRCIRDAAVASPYCALRPDVWANTPGDLRSGLRALVSRWLASAGSA
jgi:hypothetical protein